MPLPFDSIQIGSQKLKNLLAMAPIKTALGASDGQVTEQLIAFYLRRANGGVGLVLSEPLYVDRRGREHPRQLGIDANNKQDGLGRLVNAIHWGGAKVFAHLNHAGRAANPKASGGPPEAPSDVRCNPDVDVEVLSIGRIAEIIDTFVDAASRAKIVGFDGIELQFGLGYLVSQFLSSATNLRTDTYGGDLERRMRFGREVFTAVREAVGEEFPISVRISGSEKVPEGLDIDDAKELARRLESWGADLIHVATGSACQSPAWYFQHMALPAGVNENLATQIREVVGLPVMAAGRLGDPARIREVLQFEMVDMVALGRPLLADPDLPLKMHVDRDDEVHLCGRCLQGCLGRVKAGQSIGCNFNPEVGHELEEIDDLERVTPDHPRKRVVVVGGGPAGMQAALTAHQQGHQVTLFEKEQLGGQFTLAFVPPGKRRLKHPLRSLVAQVERSTIEVRLGEEATMSELKALAPAVVVIATGSRPTLPEIPGLHDPITAEEVLAGSRETGDRVLVLGGGMIGMETAEFLTQQQGKQCVVSEVLDDVAQDMNPISRNLMMKRLASLPVTIHTGTKVVRFENKLAFAEHLGKERELGLFDSVVVAVGNQPFAPLSEQLRNEGTTALVVGDADTPGPVCDAVASGHWAATGI